MKALQLLLKTNSGTAPLDSVLARKLNANDAR
jgi:hypothetical protein